MMKPATDCELARTIDGLLPQTQCRMCGHPGCRPYAEAISGGIAPINRCLPGGDELIAEIAAVLGVPPLPLDTTHGTAAAPAVAVIDETVCIGCALCISACPVDAISGAAKLMHTVIAAECTGCALCLPPCPVDCIMLSATGAPPDRATQRAASTRLKQRHEARQQRLQEQAARKQAERATAAAGLRKRATLARALARARSRLSGSQP